MLPWFWMIFMHCKAFLTCLCLTAESITSPCVLRKPNFKCFHQNQLSLKHPTPDLYLQLICMGTELVLCHRPSMLVLLGPLMVICPTSWTDSQLTENQCLHFFHLEWQNLTELIQLHLWGLTKPTAYLSCCLGFQLWYCLPLKSNLLTKDSKQPHRDYRNSMTRLQPL